MSNLPANPGLMQRYFAMFGSMTPRMGLRPSIEVAAGRIVENRERYEALVMRFANAMPWVVPGILHTMECGGDFSRHLHNGDSLARRTVHVPAGRPVNGKPPFTWLESAWDALRYDGFHRITDWSVAGILYAFERYNGLGYQQRGINSPYLWAGSNHEQPGKFVADGKFDPNARSKQLGAAVLLQHLCRTHAVALKGTAS